MAAEPRGGRYETLLKLASGGMATVYVGALRGALGFRQLVAIKKPHAHLLDDPEFRRELLAEARLASLIHHANVVDVRDVDVTDASVALVMDYIEGASVGELLVAASRGIVKMRPGVAVRIALDALAGLHAAHEQTDEVGKPLGLVHRDVSPQNVLVGTDGVSRVTDFGVAKFSRRSGNSTNDGSLKGKLAYMAPEYLKGERIDRRFDVFAVGVVLWEMLTGKRLFRGEHEADTMQRVLNHQPESLEGALAEAGRALDPVLACALAKKPDERFQTAAAMAKALENAAGPAGLLVSYTEVAEVVKAAVGPDLEERKQHIRARFSQEPALPSSALDRMGADVPSTQPVPAPSAIPTKTEPIPAAALPMNATAIPSTKPSPLAPGSSTLASPAQAQAQEPFKDMTANAVSSAAGVPKKGLPAPFIVGGVFLVTVALAGGLAVWRMQAAGTTQVAGGSSPTGSASVVVAAPSPSPTPSPSSSPSPSTSTSTTTSTSGSVAPSAGHGVKIRPIVTGKATGSGPPPNPYAN
jgi:serine/threonine-protein kinase